MRKRSFASYGSDSDDDHIINGSEHVHTHTHTHTGHIEGVVQVTIVFFWGPLFCPFDVIIMTVGPSQRERARCTGVENVFVLRTFLKSGEKGCCLCENTSVFVRFVPEIINRREPQPALMLQVSNVQVSVNDSPKCLPLFGNIMHT